MKIFDTHCHLNHPDLINDLDKILKDAKEVGVDGFLVVGFDKQTSIDAIEIAKKYNNVYAAIGFHPTEIEDLSEEDFLLVMEMLSNKKVVALGEIGLDYYWIKDKEKQEKQKQYFIRQIKYANKYNLPIVVHCRDAIEDCYNILKDNEVINKGVLHCFSSSFEMATKFIKLGYYIGLDGPVTFTNSKTPKEVARQIPLEKLLVETDCPYLTPHPFRGKRNEPKFITLIIDEIAKIRNVDSDTISEATFENAKKLFHV